MEADLRSGFKAVLAQPLPGSDAREQATVRLRHAFEHSRHPMLIADDQRRWVCGNAGAETLLGIPREEICWHTMDEFTLPEELSTLGTNWENFLSLGAAEGWHRLSIPNRGGIPVEFSATAGILPARHLTVFSLPEETLEDELEFVGPPWAPVVQTERERVPLTDREREVMTLTAAGLRGPEIAEQLYLSPDTIKSHMQNTMEKLGVHTRAHAVAVALVEGQIAWEA